MPHLVARLRCGTRRGFAVSSESWDERRNLSILIQDAEGHWQDNHDIAQSNNLALVAYEAGQHFVPQLLHGRSAGPNSPRWLELAGDPDGEIDDEFIELISEFNRSSQMRELYEFFLERWEHVGGRTVVFYFDMGDPSQHGNFGHRVDFADEVGAVKYEVVRYFALSN